MRVALSVYSLLLVEIQDGFRGLGNLLERRDLAINDVMVPVEWYKYSTEYVRCGKMGRSLRLTCAHAA